MNDIQLKDLLNIAVRAAQAAGNHAAGNAARKNEISESFDHDVKLILDIEAQRAAEKVIFSAFPDHAILGEEDVTPNGDTEYEWVIDPIDGTMNFSHGSEYWCSSVAVRKGQTILAGCVYAPKFKALYTAHLEDAARLNGDPIRIAETPELAKAMIYSGISKHMATSQESHFEIFRDLELSAKKVRINGAAALDLCRVADGTADGFFEGGIYLWDYAAAGLIAERAGAALTVYPREDDLHGATVLSANSSLIDGLNEIYLQNLPQR